jgi:hypothetical protein
MTYAEIASFLIAIVTIGSFFLAIRSTSYNELRGLYDALKDDFEEYKEDSKKSRADMESEIKMLTRQNTAFKKYIDRLIEQLEGAKIVPVKMEENDRNP